MKLESNYLRLLFHILLIYSFIYYFSVIYFSYPVAHVQTHNVFTLTIFLRKQRKVPVQLCPSKSVCSGNNFLQTI